MTLKIDHWRIYSPRSRGFLESCRQYRTRAEAEKKITSMTAGRRNAEANASRNALAAVPVLEDGTSPRAAEWQSYFDALQSEE
jgi:hypothetical protein